MTISRRFSTPQQVSFLTQQECAETVAQVDALAEHWMHLYAPEVGIEVPCYTLGVAVTYVRNRRYRKDQIDDYPAAVAAIRPLLEAQFAPLYRKLADQLGTLLGASVVYDGGLGLPGFHVFMAHPYCTQPLSPIHIDAQYMDLPVQGARDVDSDFCVSVTLPLELPASGAGIDFYDAGLDDVAGLDHDQAQCLLRSRPKTHYEYRRGRLVVHSGRHFHQAAPTPEYVPGERRITLQGHALYADDRWLFYW